MSLVTETLNTGIWNKLSALADAQYEARHNLVLKDGFTAEMVRNRQAKVREDFLRLLGPLPEKTPLNPIITGTMECGDYRIEKVAFESRPGFHVTANIYLPADLDKPRPGILVPSGHEDGAKAMDAYQRVCISMVRHGFVAMSFDPIGQGERHQFLNEAAKSITRGGTTDHTLLDVGAKLVGSSFVAYELWDSHRAVDYLADRPEVDETRLGCTGNSGGGMQTVFISAFDSRITIAAPCCSIMTMQRKIQTMYACDGCQHLAEEGLLGLELADYLSLHAPNPLIILAADQDNFEIASSREVYAELCKVYEGLGHAEKVSFFTWDDGHAFSKPRRQAAVQWMRTWFLNDDSPIEEPDADTLSREELNVTESGEVLTFFPGELKVRDLNVQRACELEEKRSALRASRDKMQWLADVRKLLGIPSKRKSPECEITESCSHEYYRFRRAYLTRGDDIVLPVIIFESVASPPEAGRAVHIIADDRGKEVYNPPAGKWKQLLLEGAIVIAADLYGYGELADDATKNKDKYWNREHRTAVISMHVGKPLPGQRTADILAILDYLDSRDDVDTGRISLYVKGDAGSAGVYAAALDERICELSVSGSISSLMDVVANPLERGLLAQVVPFALDVFDLPELVESINPRQVRFED